MAFTSKSKAPAKGKLKFQYKPTSPEKMRERATQTGGTFDSTVLDSIKTFNPKQGDYDIRILPPTWEDASSFGYEVWQHYQIGPDGGTYLCLQKMKGERCPICEERQRAERAGEEELAAALKPGKRVAMWVIDRSAEKEGPKLWLAPWTLERDVCALAIDKKTGEVYQLDNPEEGYDVSFTVQGEKLTKKYVGIQIARRPSPLHDDEDKMQEWLDYVVEHPIPECLVYRDPEYLEDVLGAGVESKPMSKPKPDTESKSESKFTARPKLGKKVVDEQEEEEADEDSGETADLSWEKVHEMSEDELLELCEQVELDPADCPDDAEPATWVCEQLGIEKPKPKESGKLSFKAKLAELRRK